MSKIQKARDERGMSQIEVSRRTGISRPQLQRLEAGLVLATPEQARALRELLGVVVLESKNVIDFSEVRRRAGIHPYALDPVNPLPWKTAWESWGTLGLSSEVRDWMSEFLPADSARECSGLGQCAAAGAQPFLGNPHQWGFDGHVVVDRQGRLLGARVLPGLCYSKDDVDMVLWPQVCLRIDDRHCYRVDGLMFYRHARKRCWPILEFDCEGHDFRRDAYRSVKIGLPEVRITGAEIKARQTFALLLQRAEESMVRSSCAGAPR